MQTPLLFPWAYLQVLLFYNFNRLPCFNPLWKKKSSAERSKSIISSFDRKYKLWVLELLKLSRDSQEKIGVSISQLFADFTKGSQMVAQGLWCRRQGITLMERCNLVERFMWVLLYALHCILLVRMSEYDFHLPRMVRVQRVNVEAISGQFVIGFYELDRGRRSISLYSLI